MSLVESGPIDDGSYPRRASLAFLNHDGGD